MSFYYHPETLSAQVQATGAWLHIGHRLMGWGRFDYRERPRWLLFGLTLWAPVSHCGMREAFGLRVGRMRLTYWTKGETHPGHHRWDERGLRLHFLPRRRRSVA